MIDFQIYTTNYVWKIINTSLIYSFFWYYHIFLHIKNRFLIDHLLLDDPNVWVSAKFNQ